MWYETLIPRILNMTLTGSLVIGIVLVCRCFLRKAPRILSYGLWAVVLFRLLCPVSLSAQVSLLSLFQVPATESSTIEYIPTDIVSDPFPEVDFLVDTASDVLNDSLPQGWEQVESRPLSDIFSVATGAWLVGVAVMALCSLISLFRLKRHLRGAVRLRENIHVSSGVDTPIVMGLFHPKIYLPAALSPAEQKHVLLHERHHIHRGDHILRPLAFLALSLHWFNPLVWLSFFLSEKDMEMSCDEAVVKNMDRENRCDYSQSLLRLAAGRRMRPASPLSFCEGDPAGRIKNILRWRRPSRLTWAVWGCVCLLLCVSLATDPVVAVDPGLYQSFRGRISFELPEGYDYILVTEPVNHASRPRVVIYRESSRYPVSYGCISLDFSRISPSNSSHPVSESSTELENGTRTTSYHYAGSANWFRRDLHIPGQGAIQITTHNQKFWTETDYAQYADLISTITVTSHEDPIYFALDGGGHLTVSTSDVSDYFLYTEGGTICIDLSGAQGSASVTLYEAFTDKGIQTFTTENAALDDHFAFTGLSMRKAYYLQVTGADDAEITIFRKEG